jgi:hypothetical protein
MPVQEGEMNDSSNGNRPKLSEKGLLTPDNWVVALIDHQGQMLFGTSTSAATKIRAIKASTSTCKAA